MAIYLKKFDNHTQYENYINGSGAILPNVSICTTEGYVHYNPLTPPTPVETRVVATFNVEDTSQETEILSWQGDGTSFTSVEIDGVEQPSVEYSYQFSTTGEHIIKYTLANQTSIGSYAFTACSGLTSIYIPDSVTSIGEGAFDSCGDLTSCTIGSGVTSISRGVFAGCSGLTSIDIPDSITTIGNDAFQDCYSLNSCTIGNGVISIGSNAFAFCHSLASINIPSSITSIGDYAFCECYGLDSTTVNAIIAINDSAFYCEH